MLRQDRPGRGGGASAPAVSDRGRGAGTVTPAPWGAWEWEFRATRTASTSPCAQTRHKIPLGSLAELCRSANVKRSMGGDLGTPRLRDPAFASSAERRWALIAGIWEVDQEYRCVTYYAFVLKVAGEMGMLMNEV